MASSSSSAAVSLSATNERNRVVDGYPPVALVPPLAWPNPPPPPPPPEGHAVYVQQLYLDPARRRRVLRRELSFLGRTVMWGLMIFLSIACFSVLMWLVFHPTFPKINVVSATMSTVNITRSAATAEFNITILLTNPNRYLSTIYDRMKISLLYPSEEVLLSQNYQSSFVQPKRNQTTIKTNLSFTGVDLGNNVVKFMKQDLGNGILSLGIKIVAIVRYRNGKWKTKSQFMRAYCGGVSFVFTSNDKPGIFLNPYQECEVYIYSK